MRQLLLPICISIFCCFFVACQSSFNPNGLYILANKTYNKDNTYYYYDLARLFSLSDTADHFVMDCHLIAGVRKRKINFSFSNSAKKYYLNDTIRLLNATYKIVGLVHHENGDTSLSFHSYGNPEVNFRIFNNAITPASDDSLHKEAMSHFQSKLREDLSILRKYGEYPIRPVPSASLHYSARNQVDVILAKERKTKK